LVVDFVFGAPTIRDGGEEKYDIDSNVYAHQSEQSITPSDKGIES
jgi:hypothetical protein